MGEELLQSIFTEKDLRILINEKINRSQQYAFAAQKAKGILGSIRREVASRGREVIAFCEAPAGVLRPRLGLPTEECYEVFEEGPQR